MDVRNLTDAEIEAEMAALEAERVMLRARMVALSREQGDRERDRMLARDAERYTDDELARMAALRREIRPAGVASGEAFGTPGARG